MNYKDYLIEKYSEEENKENDFKNLNDMFEYFNIKEQNNSSSGFNLFQSLKSVFSSFKKRS